MESRLLARAFADLKVSRACFGTMTFGLQNDEAAAARLVDICLERGVNFFDTANVYSMGAAETMLGKALKGRRHKVVLASKVRLAMGDGPEESGLSRAAIQRAIEESLTRLQTDYLDIYYLHAPDWSTPIEETLETIDHLVRAGKVCCPATSNYAGWQVCQMHWIGERMGYQPPVISQPMYNLLARGIEQEYVAMCKEIGVSIVAYNPLAAGLLTGKYHVGHPAGQHAGQHGKHQGAGPPPGTRFDLVPMHRDRFWHAAYFDAVEELRGVADRAGRRMVDLSLSWLLHHTAADCVVLGASKEEQLMENLDAFERGPLSEDVLAACDAVWQRLRGITPKYNR